MVQCCAYGCTAKGQHIFPKDQARRKLWEIALKRVGFKNSKFSRLCGAHFKPEDYISEGFYTGLVSTKRILNKTAVPSLFCFKKQPSPFTTAREPRVNIRASRHLDFIDKRQKLVENDSKTIKKRKSATTRVTPPKKIHRKVLLVSSDEILGDDDIPGQSTSTDRTLSKFEEIQSQEKFIQRQSLKASVSPKKGRKNPRILKRKTLLNNKKQQNQSTNANTSDVQGKKRTLRKNDVASSNPTWSKRPPVRASNSKVCSIISPSTRVQNSEILKHKSSSNRNIQQNQITDYLDDEFDIFAKDIAFQLRQLPYYNALQCQEKIKRIINQESFIVQQSRHQGIIIIKREPGFNEEEPLQPVSSQGTIQTIIKEEPVISEDEYPHPVLGSGTIYNENSIISEEEHSHTVSGQGTIQTIIKEEPVISEDQYQVKKQ